MLGEDGARFSLQIRSLTPLMLLSSQVDRPNELPILYSQLKQD
jgi:hypothetical protein